MKLNAFGKALLIGGLYFSSLDAALAAVSGEVDSKAIRLRDNAPAAAPTGSLTLSVHPVKTQFKVGESMSFKVKGNADYYLYVFNIDESTGESVVLIPNKKTKTNQMKKNQTYTVPGTVEFYSDTAGYEKVVFVASREKIDLEKVNSEALGDFSKSKTAELEGAFVSKNIRIRERPATETGGATLLQEANVKVLSIKIVP